MFSAAPREPLLPSSGPRGALYLDDRDSSSAHFVGTRAPSALRSE
jgi:hypothetical protein